MKSTIKCCQYCQKRFLGCHDVCGRYKAEKAEFERQKEEINRQRNDDSNYRSFRAEQSAKFRRRKRGEM